MMRGIWALWRIALNNNFGWSWMRVTYGRQRKKIIGPLLIFLTLLVTGAALIAGYVEILNLLYTQGAAIGQGGVILTLAILAAQLIIGLFGIYWLVSAFYFSRDLPQLVPLPLTPQAVLGSKFLQVMVNELLMAALIVIPALGVYAHRAGAGLGFWLAAIPVLVLLPVIPLAIGGIIVVPIMRFVNVRRSRDLLTFIAFLFGLILVVVTQYFTSRIPDGQETEYLNRILASNQGLILAIGERFPPSLWASRGLAAYDSMAGWGQLLLFIGVSAALLAILFFLAKRLFYQGLLAGSGIMARRAKLTEADLGRLKAQAPKAALVQREWRLLLRNPAFLLQWLMSAIIFPLIIGIWYITGNKSIPIDRFAAEVPAFWQIIAAAGLIAFSSLMLQLSPTTISREGRNFWISKVIPVAPVAVVQAKQRQIWEATILSLLPVIVTAAFVMRFRFETVIPGIMLGLAASYPLLNLGLLLDLVRPRLEWTNPQQAMKGNVNVLYAMALGFAILGVMGVLTFWAWRAHWPAYTIVLGLALLLTVAGYALGGAVKRLAPGRFGAIER